jgi:hypothetical protein
MWKSLHTIVITAGLAACQTSPAPKLEPGPSVKLTPDDIREIHESVIWDLKESYVIYSTDSDTVQFGRIAAAKTWKDLIMVCGFVRLKQSNGGYSDERIFQGFLNNSLSHLRNDRVWTSFVSKAPEGTAQLLEKCRATGVKL